MIRTTHRRRPQLLGRARGAFGAALRQKPLCRPIGGTADSGWLLGCATCPACSGEGRPVNLFPEVGGACRRAPARAVAGEIAAMDVPGAVAIRKSSAPPAEPERPLTERESELLAALDAEREACAELCDAMYDEAADPQEDLSDRAADKIRARIGRLP